jgi:ketosteroid isomerase-like protein
MQGQHSLEAVRTSMESQEFCEFSRTSDAGVRPVSAALGVALACVCLSPAPASAASTDDNLAIMAIEKSMAGEQTASAITANWSKDVVWFDMIGGNIAGLDAVRTDLGNQIAQLSNIRVHILDLSVRAGKTVAFSFSTQRITGEGRNGAPGMAVEFRQTDGFEKRRGKWVLVHQHISVPFDPVSGKAILMSK